MVVDDNPVVDHELRWHCANTGRRGDREALVHVGGQRLRHPLQRIDLIRGSFFGTVFHRGDDGGG